MLYTLTAIVDIQKLFNICILCFFITNLTAQTTFDVFTYTEPKGFAKEDKKGMRTYTKSDNKNGTYCILSLYTQTESKGTLQNDFDEDWQTFAVKQLGVTATPQMDKGDEITGWKTLSGAANFEFNSGTSMAIVTTAKKDNIATTILVVSNAQNLITELDAFFNSIKLTKTKAIVTTTTKPQNNTTNKSSIGVRLSDNDIAGLWLNYSLDMNSKMMWFERVFFSDGKSLCVIPRKGLFNYSTSNETILSVGNYSFNGSNGTNKKTVNTLNGDKLKLVKPNQLDIDGKVYFRCAKVNGQKLQVSLTSFANAQDPSIQSLPYGDKPVIVLNNNGTFIDEGIFNTYLFDKATNEVMAKPGNGNYEIKDYTIFLKYEDGRVRQESFYSAYADKLEEAKIFFIGGAQINKIK